jgi:serine acetyltransferase
VIGGRNRIGNYANINTCTNIVDNGSTIGDFLFLASGAKITKGVHLGNDVMIGANSVVNQSFDNNTLLVGMPAIAKRTTKRWIKEGGYELDERWYNRLKNVDNLKERMGVYKK